MAVKSSPFLFEVKTMFFYSKNIGYKKDFIDLHANDIKMHLKKTSKYVSLLMLIFTVYSCTVETYDLSNVDTSININGKIGLPIGSSEKITIEQILKNNENSIISFDKDGVLHLDYMAETFNYSICIDSFVAQDNAIKLNKTSKIFNTPTDLAGKTSATIIALNKDFVYGNDSNISGSSDIVIDDNISSMGINEIPFTIEDIYNIACDAELCLKWNIRNSVITKCIISKGMEVIFPDFIKFENLSTTIFEKQGQKLILKDNLSLSLANNELFKVHITDLDITALPQEQGFIHPEKIFVQEQIKYDKIVFTFNSKNFNTSIIPANIEVSFTPELKIKSVNNATVLLGEMDFVQDCRFEMPELPPILKSEKTVLDLYKPCFYLDINNKFPSDIALTADLLSYKSNQKIAALQLGKNPEIVVKKSEANHIKIQIDEFGSLFNPMPDIITIENIKGLFGKTQTTIWGGKQYDFTIDFKIYTPLAFGADFLISSDYELKGLNSTFNDDSLDFKQIDISLNFNAYNSIPLMLQLDAEAIDIEGNVLDEIQVSIPNKLIDASTDGESDAISAFEVGITDIGGQIRDFDGIRFKISVANDEIHKGIPLKKSQGIKLSDIKLNLDLNLNIKY